MPSYDQQLSALALWLYVTTRQNAFDSTSTTLSPVPAEGWALGADSLPDNLQKLGTAGPDGSIAWFLNRIQVLGYWPHFVQVQNAFHNIMTSAPSGDDSPYHGGTTCPPAPQYLTQLVLSYPDDFNPPVPPMNLALQEKAADAEEE